MKLFQSDYSIVDKFSVQSLPEINSFSVNKDRFKQSMPEGFPLICSVLAVPDSTERLSLVGLSRTRVGGTEFFQSESTWKSSSSSSISCVFCLWNRLTLAALLSILSLWCHFNFSLSLSLFFIFFILTLSQFFEAKAYIGYWIRIGLNNYSTVLNCATVFSEGSNIAYCKYLPLLI